MDKYLIKEESSGHNIFPIKDSPRLANHIVVWLIIFFLSREPLILYSIAANDENNNNYYYYNLIVHHKIFCRLAVKYI